MFEKISKKDLIAINQHYDSGTVINSSSLDFALAQANESKSWLKSCAYLVRAVLLDHVFEEGNKRTAADIMVAFFEENDLQYDPDKITKGIVTMLKKNVTSIMKIEEVISNAIVR
jgi:prophage maintenance system killer protein